MKKLSLALLLFPLFLNGQHSVQSTLSYARFTSGDYNGITLQTGYNYRFHCNWIASAALDFGYGADQSFTVNTNNNTLVKPEQYPRNSRVSVGAQMNMVFFSGIADGSSILGAGGTVGINI